MIIDWYYLEKSKQTCSMRPDIIDYITSRLIVLEDKDDEFSFSESERLIETIKFNQLDPILAGLNYGQKDIIRHLNKLM